MNNNNKLQNRTEYLHIIFYFKRKYYTKQDLLIVFYAGFLDLIYQYNTLPPDTLRRNPSLNASFKIFNISSIFINSL